MSRRVSAQVAFIGSHGIRKSTAALAFAHQASRMGLAPDLVAEVVRSCPLPFNEGATPSVHLWVITTQIARELEAGTRSSFLVCDRAVLDNFAHYRRAAGGRDPFVLGALVRTWTGSYGLLIRLLPDVDLVADGIRSTNDSFRDDIEWTLDTLIAKIIHPCQLVTLRASEVDEHLDFRPYPRTLMEREA